MTSDFTTPPADSVLADPVGAFVPHPAADGSTAGDAGSPTATRFTAASLARQRRRVLARMWAAAEGQIQEIESRLAQLQGGGSDVVQEARTLALLARVVRELSREAETERAQAGARRPVRAVSRRFPAIHRNDPAGSEDEPTARTLDQLRDDLARHLERLRDAAGAAGPASDAERA